jgi:hypothetical protein
MFPNDFATGTGRVPVQRQMKVNKLENNENKYTFTEGYLYVYLFICSFIHSWLLVFRRRVIEGGIFRGKKYVL